MKLKPEKFKVDVKNIEVQPILKCSYKKKSVCLKCFPVKWTPLLIFMKLSWISSEIPISKYTFLYKNQLLLAEAQLFLFLNSILTSFQPWPPLNYMFKKLLVISSLRFPDQFASGMNIFQSTNFKISNLRLAVLIKVVLIKKSVCVEWRADFLVFRP